MMERGWKLSIEKVGQTRRSQGREVEILSDVSLTVRSGERVVVVGPSGGGKSSLLRLLNRLEDPCSGRILLDGIDLADLDPVKLRQRVGLVPQKPFMFEGTVLDNLQAPFRFLSSSPPFGESPQIQEILALCRLPAGVLARQAGTLSLGEQQRVALGRALLLAPEVLLLDEPTSALDRPTGDQLAATLAAIAQARGLTLVLVTHDLRLAGKLAERLVFLADGRILEDGPPNRLLQQPQSAALRHFLAEPGQEAG